MGKYRNWVFFGILCCVIIICIVIHFYSRNTVTTVIVVRHAERANSMPPDRDAEDPLTSAGEVRAEELARVLETAGVKAIYATDTVRTESTAEPLRSANNLTIRNYSSTSEPVDFVRSYPGGVILIVAHSGDVNASNSVSRIVSELGGGDVGTVNEFDNLFVLTFSRLGGTKLIKATYGAPR